MKSSKKQTHSDAKKRRCALLFAAGDLRRSWRLRRCCPVVVERCKSHLQFSLSRAGRLCEFAVIAGDSGVHELDGVRERRDWVKAGSVESKAASRSFGFWVLSFGFFSQ